MSHLSKIWVSWNTFGSCDILKKIKGVYKALWFHEISPKSKFKVLGLNDNLEVQNLPNWFHVKSE